MRKETLKTLDGYGLSEPDFIEAMREVFPHGHEDFLPTVIAQMELHSVKNHDYAAGGSPLGNFERVATILALYPGLNLGDKRVVALAYALKQLDAVLYGLSKNITHKVEGFVDRLNDIAIYANIVICMFKGDARAVAIDQQFGVDLNNRKDPVGGQCGEPMPEGKPYPTIPQTTYRPGSVLISHDAVKTVPGPSCPELNTTRSGSDKPWSTPSPYDLSRRDRR